MFAGVKVAYATFTKILPFVNTLFRVLNMHAIEIYSITTINAALTVNAHANSFIIGKMVRVR